MGVVKQVFDLKGPLKGKGGTLAQWRDDTQARLAEVYAEMAQLSTESRSIDGRQFALYVYRLRDASQLRWRMKNKDHATWPVIEPLLADMAPGLAQWYRRAEEVAQILNHREQALRYELKTVCRVISVGPRTAQSYRGSIGRGVGGGRPRSKSSTAAVKATGDIRGAAELSR
ncbi:hypothetical protein RA210_U10384 [Rubrivivax sp. A210]|nr:hypothetical protein RA210_U10384 [Rubrivivax sp. A210]